MKNLLIIGARGLGRDVYNLAIDSIGYGTEFTIKGFLDDKKDALAGYKGYPPLISSHEEYEIQKDDVFICALGFPSMKKQYASVILKKGGEFINLIHKEAHISKNTVWGKGCIIFFHTFLSCDANIGNFVTLMPFSTTGHDVIIGDWCHIGVYAFMGGFSQVGEESLLHTGSILVPNKKIGNRSVLGAGAVALEDIEDDITVFGMPAHKIWKRKHRN